MSNTVITNYTDLNGPSAKADSSVVVIVNKDGSLSVDQKLLGTLMGTDGSQSAGISVVRVGHDGPPDDATDSESDDDKIPHVTLTVDSYYDEPNSIIKYDSGAEMLQTLRVETRENSLLGFQNDHCYTPFISPDDTSPQRRDPYAGYDKPIIEIKRQSPPKPVPSSKKITILDQKIIPKGKKLILKPNDPVGLKNKDLSNKQSLNKSKQKLKALDKRLQKTEESESSSLSSSGESLPDRDSDSDYNDIANKSITNKRGKLKPRLLKSTPIAKAHKNEPKIISRVKANRSIIRKEVKDKIQSKGLAESEQVETPINNSKKDAGKPISRQSKRERKTPAHMSALLTDMSSLFSTPDVIRRISSDSKTPSFKEATGIKKLEHLDDSSKTVDVKDKIKVAAPKTIGKQKTSKSYDPMPQIDDVSLAQILQDTSGNAKPVTPLNPANALSGPALAGPLSPTLDLLGGLQPEEEGLTEDLLMHVAQLVESSENLQEVIDKQVLGKVDTAANKNTINTAFQQGQNVANLYTPTPTKVKPIEIVRRDGRVITLPPIEAPATRASKRKSQVEPTVQSTDIPEPVVSPTQPPVVYPETPEMPITQVAKQYTNKKIGIKKPSEPPIEVAVEEKTSPESQESWNSEDDPFRLWCICRQPHNNRFMICCDGCEDWFHGKCVNITKAMGQQMEEQGIEWRCPNCVKNVKTPKISHKVPLQKKRETEENQAKKQSFDLRSPYSKSSGCIVCQKPARASTIYCSDACILKHAEDSLVSNAPTKMDDTGTEKKKESRVIVFERKTGRCLAGPSAPTAENLRAWLQQNPTFEVVRPGSLSAIKPKQPGKKSSGDNKIQTTLNFGRIPKKSPLSLKKPEVKESPKVTPSKELPKLTPSKEASKSTPSKEPPKPSPLPKTPLSSKSQSSLLLDSPKPSTSSARQVPEPKRPARTSGRAPSFGEKTPSPATSRRKDSQTPKLDSADTIRENVRKALQEQITLRMKETATKFTEVEIAKFATETEEELHELFKDVGVKYKAKYRSLMFNIKDRKNLSLWQKICDKSITPNQLVRLSPEELASQELAQWRDQESKHQLELIKKSELDLLAANKTYVLKTHKGEEVMETKESVSTLDPNVPVEDVVSALNDSNLGEDPVPAKETPVMKMTAESTKRSKKRARDEKASESKNKRESRRDTDSKKSKSARDRSEPKHKDVKDKLRRSERSGRVGSPAVEKSGEEKVKSEKVESSKGDTKERSRGKSRSRSRGKSRRRSRSRSRSRSRRREVRGRSTRQRSDVGRSRSQDNKTPRKKSPAEVIERPKSAMKEVHPEYDPHEPMITSALSEEDLRKSGEDYEDALKSEVVDYGASPLDSSKPFTIDTNVRKYPSRRRDKISEVESDQEPSSTVENAAATVWNGCINMVDVARFYVSAHEVSGISNDLEEDLSAELDVVGRINPDTVWDYILKMKKTGSKDIVVLKLQAANDEEKMQYIALYSYLSSRNRLGVVKVSNTTTVKDFYILPLAANTALPEVLLPLEGPGLEESKNHLLIAIVIRQRRKRNATAIPKDVIPAKVLRVTRQRSYTPPQPVGKKSTTADLNPTSSGEERDPLRSKMAELNRQIEEQKLQIRKIAQADSSVDQDEAYSPSRPLSPSEAGAGTKALADIALPDNLQEILANIKQRSDKH